MHNNNKIEKRPEGDYAKEDRVDDLSRVQWMPISLFNAIAPISLAVIVAGATVGYYAYHHVTRDSVRLTFWVSFMFSFLAFVVLLVQSVIYAQQAEFMRQQSKAMRESVERTDTIIEKMQDQLKVMRDALTQSERAVKAAEDNVRAVEKTSIYENRAYVIPKVRDVSNVGPKIRLRIENRGNTPANNVRVRYAYGLRDQPPHQEVEGQSIAVYDIGFTETETYGVIAAHSSYQVLETPTIDGFTPSQEEDCRTGKLQFYCWGRIDYEDIFQERRYTDFCFVVSHEHPDGYPCKHGNEAN